MQRGKISIAKKTLELLKNKSWDKITLSNLLNDQNNKAFNNKNDFLININRYFDYLLKKNLSSLEQSSSKDMLFEVLMARLDILNTYRKSIKNLLKYFTSYPNKSIKLIPSFLESIILILTLSNIDVNGIKGAAKIKGIYILYLAIIYSWSKDETESLEKTMTTLDKYLTNIDRFINLL